MTEGGPAHKTEVMAMYIYKRAFMDYDFGMASAASGPVRTIHVGKPCVSLSDKRKGGEVKWRK